MVDLTRRNLMATSVAAALGASVAGVASAEVSESDTPSAPSVRGDLKRFSTAAFGAEVTGPFVFEDGSLLYSLQHPSGDNPGKFGRAAVGYFSAEDGPFQFTFDGSNDDFAEIGVPSTKSEEQRIRSKAGDYKVLIQGREQIQGGDERLGVPQTPDGTDITELASPGGGYGGNPDCNQFVATDDAGTEGYLFTNWENYPGGISRVPLSQADSGEWSADTDSDEAINVMNTDPFRDLGGTWVNCYGDLSPWGTMISSEENYSHARVSLTNTVGDIVKAESGVGLIGGCQFWNRPNPPEIGGAIDDYANSGDVSENFSPQGFWALDGIEKLAYYLGADAPDSNSTDPIGDVYPNPYRYGYHVDIRDPADDPPSPIKYWVMGRASWEAPDIQGDRKTVYGCSDGDSKGIYKFVADEPIDSYGNTDDIAGTLYAPKITNDAASAEDAGQRNSPAQTPLEIEWMELGHATNGEVEDWIAEYDDVTQVDYITKHTKYSENQLGTSVAIEKALKEADLEVLTNVDGNQSYITNQEIVDWAEQYEQRGPDGVDEELRRVPFLETRAAAKEVGASIEFNKAEGVDSVDNSQPGDFVYFGISEFNDQLADDEGDIQLDRVDGGVVYRAELEPNYNVSTLEPVISGADFTDPAGEQLDNALGAIDNVYVIRDGRVLCCEDGAGDAPNRSYPNDGLYVYQPNVLVDVDSLAVGNGSTGTADLTASSLPKGFSGAEVTVSLSDPEVATITGVSFPDALGITKSSVSSDGSEAKLRLVDLDRNVQSGGRDVTVGSLDVRADSTGTTDMNVEIHKMNDESGSQIEAEARMGVLLVGPPAVSSVSAPTDPDGDGLYEDVNGNGRLDYGDIETLFEHFDSDSVTLNKAAYDFNENGELDFDDIVTLYDEVPASPPS